MQAIQLVVVIFTSLCNIFLGFIAYRKNPKSATHRLLALITIVISLWSVSNFFSLNSTSEGQTLFWIRAVMLITTPLAPILYLFLSVFPEEKLKIKTWKAWLIIVVVIIVGIISITPLTFSGVTLKGGVKPVPGPGVLFFGISTIGFLMMGFRNIILKFRKSHGIVKLQLKYVVLGAISSFTFQVVTNYIFVIMFNLSNFVVFGPTFSLILVAFITYAVVKHNLLDIKIITTQIFTAIIWVALFSKLFAFESFTGFLIDISIFVIVFIFGILLIRSVTREVEQKEKLEHLTEKLKALDKQKDEFLSIAAHELRTPLTAINGYVSMLLDGDMGELPGGAMELLDNTSLAANRMVRLINNLLDVGRIEEGRIVYRMGYVNLADVVKTVYAEFEQETKMRKLELHLEIQKDIKDRVWVDGDRIHEVVANLLSNAFKYTEKGSVDVKALNPSETSVRVEVKDTGLGISPDDQKKLFKKYYRSKSSKGKIEGTGLGLYVVKLLVEKFNGSVGVTSKVDKGSTFWVELPLAKGDEEKHEE